MGPNDAKIENERVRLDNKKPRRYQEAYKDCDWKPEEEHCLEDCMYTNNFHYALAIEDDLS